MNKKIILTAAITACITYFVVSYRLPKEIATSAPYFSVSSHKFTADDNFRCESLIYAGVGNNPIKKSISGKVSRGTDKLSLKLNTDSIEVLSVGDVEVGRAQPDIYKKTLDNENVIVAAGLLNGNLTQMEIYILDKKTGLLLRTGSGYFGDTYSNIDYYGCN